MVRVFANDLGDLCSLPPKTQKMVLDSALINTQRYKVRIKGKVEQSRERSSTLPYISVVFQKGGFGSPSTTVANFILYSYLGKSNVNNNALPIHGNSAASFLLQLLWFITNIEFYLKLKKLVFLFFGKANIHQTKKTKKQQKISV